jgi:hypothetical protein
VIAEKFSTIHEIQNLASSEVEHSGFEIRNILYSVVIKQVPGDFSANIHVGYAGYMYLLT